MPIKKNKLFYCTEIIKLATPILGVRMLYMTVNFIGMVFIARLGQQQLAAGALVAALCNTVMVIAMSPLLATGITVSRLYGGGQNQEIGAEVRQGWLVSIAVGLFGAFVFWNLPLVLQWLHEPAELLPLTRPYFQAMAWGVVPSLVMASCHQIFFPVKKGNLVVVFSSINLVGTIGLGYALIHGYAGLPAMGMQGWAWAISIMNWLLMAATLCYLRLAPSFARYELFRFDRLWDPTRLAAFFQIGVPITVQFSSELLAFSAVNIMVGWLGVGALSVQQIVIQCSTLALMVPMGAGQASTILIGMAAGRKEFGAIREIGLVGLMLVVGVMTAIAALYLLAPMAVVGLYLKPDATENAALVSLARTMLAIVAFTQIVDAARNLLLAALRGVRDVWYPMWANMGLLWVFGLPLCYLLAFPFQQGQLGINAALLITFGLGALLMLSRFYHKTAEALPGALSGQSA